MATRARLKPRDKKFVAEYIKNGKNGAKAMLKADPTLKPESAKVTASRALSNVNVQHAINEAMAKHELTVDMAISELKKIVEQDEELGAKRLAINDTLSLYGWRKNEKPVIEIEVSGFFKQRRDVVEGEVVDE